MHARDFVYWLQGYFELINDPSQQTGLSPAQTTMIRNHLNLVFKHEIDPAMGDAKHQENLNGAHAGTTQPPPGVTYRC